MTSSVPDSAAPHDSVSIQPKGRLFYGWIIVGVMAATAALSMALGGLNFGFFIKPIGDELGVGRATFG